MAVAREYGNPDKDPGVWHVWKKDPDNKKLVRVLIREIPRAIEDAIKAAHKSNKVTVRQTGRNMGESDIDLDNERKVMRDRAAYALLDTDNYEVRVGDEEAAATYSRLLERIVEPGDVVLDKQWGKRTSELRGHVLHEHPDFTMFIVQSVDGTYVRTQEEEEALRGN